MTTLPSQSNVILLPVLRRPTIAPGARCHTCGDPAPAWALRDGWRIHVLCVDWLICPCCASALPPEDLR